MIFFHHILNTSEVNVGWGASCGPVDFTGDAAVGVVAGGKTIGLSAVRCTCSVIASFPVWIFGLHEMQVLNEEVRM